MSTAAQNDDAVCPYNANWLPGIPPTCGELSVKFYKIYKMATCCLRTLFFNPSFSFSLCFDEFQGKNTQDAYALCLTGLHKVLI